MDDWEKEVDEPENLQTQCIHYIAHQMECIATKTSDTWCLKPGISLPQVLCEKLLSTCVDLGVELEDSLLHIFHDVSNTRLRRAFFRNSSKITDNGLEYILRHGLTELDISQCECLTPKTVEHINKYCKGLNTLLIGDSHSILSDIDFGFNEPLQNDVGIEVHFEDNSEFYKDMDSEPHDSYFRCKFEPFIKRVSHRPSEDQDGAISNPDGAHVFKQDFIFDCPDLRMFSLHNLTESSHHWSQDLIATILSNLTKLRYLDLTGCDINVEFMDCIESLRCLTHLIIFDVPINYTEGAFQVIGKVKSLRLVLDLKILLLIV